MSARAFVRTGLALAVVTFAGHAEAAPAFSYDAPGKLASGSGKGRADAKVYAPEMRFPIEAAPAYANSQVWGRGGMHGGGGTQCDAQNFSYPWRDNYCETRSWDMPLCPSGEGHQGQDIRAASCQDRKHWAVAAADGTITQIGSYSVYVVAPDGTRYDYLHMADVTVKEGDKVKRGQRLGTVSNQFNGERTTIHLHFNIRQNVAGIGSVYVPPYTSLVESYEELLGIRSNEPKEVPPSEPPPPPPAAPPPSATVRETPLAPPEPEPAVEESDAGCAIGTAAPRGPSAFVFMSALVAAALRRRKRGSLPACS